jgi:nicotinamide-nucleotide amidase
MKEVLGFHLWGIDDETPQNRAGALLTQMGLTLAVAESCTGGQLAAAVSDIPGSSAYFKGALVPYRNEAKISFGVDAELIENYGVISKECAVALALSARKLFNTDVGIGVTGVAGPSEQEEKPVGLVYIAIDVEGLAVNVTRHQFPGRRPLIRGRTVAMALLQLCQILLTESSAHQV